MQHTIYAPQLLFYGLTAFSLLAVLLQTLTILGVRPRRLTPRKLALATIGIGYTFHYFCYGLMSEGVGFNFTQTQSQTIDWWVQFLFALLLYGHTFVKRRKHTVIVGVASVASALILPLTLWLFPTFGVESTSLTVPIVLLILTIGLCVIAAVRTIYSNKDANENTGKRAYYLWMPFILLPLIIALRIFPVWHMGWWASFALYSTLATMAMLKLIQMYRRFIRFNLNHYFALASTIILVVVSTLTSIFITNAQTNFMEETINDRAEALVESLATQETIETNGFADLMLTNLEQSFSHLDGIAVCDHNGTNLFESTTLSESLIGSVPENLVNQAVAGEIVAMVDKMEEPGVGITYRSLAFAPLYTDFTLSSSVPDVVITAQELPRFAESLQEVRLTVLSVSAVGMGILFVALMGIVGYGDQLLTRQTDALQKAYDDLQRSEGLRDGMTNMIVHDMRQPLSAVQLDLGLIRRYIEKGRDTDQTLKTVRRATNSTERSLFLLNDILYLAKLESGTFNLQSKAVHPAELIVERVQIFAPEAEAGERELGWSADPNLPMIEVDEQLFQRVLDNLVSNAIRYTKRQEKILVTAVEEGDFVRFSVSDTGIGIRPEVLDTIFDKFVQVAKDGTKQRKGVGLGLAFCRMAVQAHGGNIGVESVVGQGTTFTFTIPIASEKMIAKPILLKIPKKTSSQLSSNLL